MPSIPQLHIAVLLLSAVFRQVYDAILFISYICFILVDRYILIEFTNNGMHL